MSEKRAREERQSASTEEPEQGVVVGLNHDNTMVVVRARQPDENGEPAEEVIGMDFGTAADTGAKILQAVGIGEALNSGKVVKPPSRILMPN